MNWPELLHAILSQYQLRPSGLHGVTHWARVLENGRRLAEQTQANLAVVELFAVFHDACRFNDGWDHGHGERGATLAERMRGRYFDLPEQDFSLLLRACRQHTGGRSPDDITILTCWDSDRLDLLRVGITPNPRYLVTEAARGEEVRIWANQRAQSRYVPALVWDKWGLDEHYHPV